MTRTRGEEDVMRILFKPFVVVLSPLWLAAIIIGAACGACYIAARAGFELMTEME